MKMVRNLAIFSKRGNSNSMKQRKSAEGLTPGDGSSILERASNGLKGLFPGHDVTLLVLVSSSPANDFGATSSQDIYTDFYRS